MPCPPGMLTLAPWEGRWCPDAVFTFCWVTCGASPTVASLLLSGRAVMKASPRLLSGSSVLMSALVPPGVWWVSFPSLDRGSNIVSVLVVDRSGYPLSWAWLRCGLKVRGIIPSWLNIGGLGCIASHVRKFLLAVEILCLM